MSWLDRKRPAKTFSHVDTRGDVRLRKTTNGEWMRMLGLDPAQARLEVLRGAPVLSPAFDALLPRSDGYFVGWPQTAEESLKMGLAFIGDGKVKP